jgi:hypothetical protein
MTKLQNWIDDKKQIYVAIYKFNGHDQKRYYLTYGNDKDDAIKDTMLDGAKGVSIESSEVKLYEGNLPDAKFAGYLK